MDRGTLLALMRLAVLIGVFVVSCGGLGYLAGRLVRRRRGRGFLIGALCAAIGLIWPAIIVSWAYYEALHYQRRGPSDPGDAPAMLIASALFAGAPILFLLSLPLAIGGAVIGQRRKSLVSPIP
jgi:hypothetical protein